MILLVLGLQAVTLATVVIVGVLFVRHTTAPERHYKKDAKP